jgi:hypothetical protein
MAVGQADGILIRHFINARPLPAIALKILVSISIIASLIACDGKTDPTVTPKPIGKNWSIKLDSNLGTLDIILPQHFDTLIKWTQYSDCGDGCAKTDYRIQPKNLNIFLENGFYWFAPKDSIEQFTIKHQKTAQVHPNFNDTTANRVFLETLKSQVFEVPSQRIQVDTIFQTGNLKISALAYQTIDTLHHIRIQIVDAMTDIHGNQVRLTFEYRKSFPDSLGPRFISNSLAALQSMQLSNSR